MTNNYTIPFHAVTSAFYQSIAASDVDTEFFDASTAVEDIEDYFKKQNEFAYGVLGASTADMVSNKDAEIWNMTLDVEIYSNYRGRKVVAQKLEALLNFLGSSDGLTAMQNALKKDGFSIVSITVGNIRINLPIFSDKGIWNSGSTTITFRVSKK